jgi:hypothetical protein
MEAYFANSQSGLPTGGRIMRAKTSAISVPVSLVYTAAAVSTGQPVIIALGVTMVVFAAGYLASDLLLKRGAPGELSPSPVKTDEKSARPKLRRIEFSQASAGESLFALLFMAVTAALTILLAANAAAPFGG